MKRLLMKLLIFATAILCTVAEVSYASEIKDTVQYVLSTNSISYRLHFRFGKLPQYDEIRIQQLNKLINHFEFAGYLDEGESALSICLDGKNMLTYMEIIHGDNAISVLAPDSGHFYILPENTEFSAMSSSVLTSLDNNPVTRNLTVYNSLDTWRGFFQNLPSLFPEHASSVNILEKYRDYGTAVRKVSIVLTGDELNEFFDRNAAQFTNCGFYPNPCDMVFEGRQSFALLFTEDNSILKISYTGRAYLCEDDIRTIRIDWKTVRNDLLEKDEFELRTPNSEGTKRDNLLLTSVLKTEDGSESFIWSAETDHVSDGIRIRTFDNAELNTKDHFLTGKLTESVLSKGLDSGSEISISANVPSEGSCSGTLEIVAKKDKIEKDCIVIDFEFSPWNPAAVSPDPAEIQAITEAEYKKMQENLVTDILREIILLPEDDLVFLKNGIPDAVWQSILQPNT